MLRQRIGNLVIAGASKLFDVRLDGLGYINAQATIKAARSRQISVNEYVEQLWDSAGSTDAGKDHADAVIEEVRRVGLCGRALRCVKSDQEPNDIWREFVR